MEIRDTQVYCSLTKKAIKGVYRRHQELGAKAELYDNGGGRLRLRANVGDGEIEFTFQFNSSDDMRAVGRVFLASAELRDALDHSNALDQAGYACGVSPGAIGSAELVEEMESCSD